MLYGHDNTEFSASCSEVESALPDSPTQRIIENSGGALPPHGGYPREQHQKVHHDDRGDCENPAGRESDLIASGCGYLAVLDGTRPLASTPESLEELANDSQDDGSRSRRGSRVREEAGDCRQDRKATRSPERRLLSGQVIADIAVGAGGSSPARREPRSQVSNEVFPRIPQALAFSATSLILLVSGERNRANRS